MMDASQATATSVTSYSDEDERIKNLVRETTRSSDWFRCLRILTWKFFLMRLRSRKLCLLECLVPILLAAIIVKLFVADNLKMNNQCYTPSINLPSMGLFPYLRSLLCDGDYKCYSYDEDLPFLFDGFLKEHSRMIEFTGDLVKMTQPSNPGPIKNLSILIHKWNAIKEKYKEKHFSFNLGANNNTLQNLLGLVCGINSDPINRSLISELTQKAMIMMRGLKDVDDKLFICDAISAYLNSLEKFRNTTRLKQFILGRILYYPAIEDTTHIMQIVAKKFQLISQTRSLLREWTLRFQYFARNFTANAYSVVIKMYKDCRNNTECIKLLKNSNSTLEGSTDWQNIKSSMEMFNRISEFIVGMLDNCFLLKDKIRGYNNKTEFETDLKMTNTRSNLTPIGVIFENLPTKKEIKCCRIVQGALASITYRIDSFQIHSIKGQISKDIKWTPDPNIKSINTKYISSGLIDVQDMIEEALISFYTQQECPSTNQSPDLGNLFLPMQLKLWPGPCFIRDDKQERWTVLLPHLGSCLWIVAVAAVVRFLVMMKGKILQEYTKIYGLTEFMYFSGLFIVSFVFTLHYSLIITLMLYQFGITSLTDILLLLMTTHSYSIALISWSFYISFYFSNPIKASIFAAFMHLILTLLSEIVGRWSSLPNSMIILLSLNPQIAMHLLIVYLIRLKTINVSLTWESLNYNHSSIQQFSIVEGIIMLWIDIIFYLTITWYLNNVFSNKYRKKNSLFFMFSKDFWFTAPPPLVGDNDALSSITQGKSEESGLPKLPYAVELYNLNKKYRGMSKPVLKNFYAKFHASKISAIIGHDGCGKTTVMSIIAGIKRPDSGGVFLENYDISQQKLSPSVFLSFCAEESMLIPSLKVKEQIKFFGKLKRLSHDQIYKAISNIATQWDLEKYMNHTVTNLSNMQNKLLNLALTFMGKTHIILLDMPTKGLNKTDQKTIWENILKYKSSKTIIIATEDIEEAEYLCDYAFIWGKGNIKRFGPVSEIKQLLDIGCILKFVKSDRYPVDQLTCSQMLSLLSEKLSDIDTVGLDMISQTINHLIFSVPNKAITSKVGVKFLYDVINMKELYKWPFLIEELMIDDSSNRFFSLHKRHQMIAKMHKDHKWLAVKRKNVLNLKPSKMTVKDILLGKLTTVVLKDAMAYAKVDYLDCIKAQIYATVWKKISHFKRSSRGFLIALLAPFFILLIFLSLIDENSKTVEHGTMQIHTWWMVQQLQNPIMKTFYGNNIKAELKGRNLSEQYEAKINYTYETFYKKIFHKDGLSGTKCIQSDLKEKFKPARFDYCYKNKFEWITPDATNFTAIRRSNFSKTPCSCNMDMKRQCSKDAKPPRPRYRLSPSGFQIYDLTNYNITDYLLKSTYELINEMFGGYEYVIHKEVDELEEFIKQLKSLEKKLLAHYAKHHIVREFLERAFEVLLNSVPPMHYIRIHIDPKGYTSAPSYLNLMRNLQWRMLTVNMTDESTTYLTIKYDKIGIINYIEPFTKTSTRFVQKNEVNIAFKYWTCVIVYLSFTLVTLPLSKYMIVDNYRGSKGFQFECGLNFFVYWIFSYICDCMYYCLCSALLLVVLYEIDIDFFTGKQNLLRFVFLVMSYGPALLSMNFLLSFLKFLHLSYVGLYAFNFMLYLFAEAITYYRNTNFNEDAEVEDIFFSVSYNAWLFMIPQWCFVTGIKSFFISGHGRLIVEQIRDPKFYHQLKWGVVFALGIQPFIYISLILFIETLNYLKQFFHPSQVESELKLLSNAMEEENEEITNERINVKEMYEHKDSMFRDNLLIVDLHKKTFRRKLLNGLTFSVRAGESFCLVSNSQASLNSFVSILGGLKFKSRGRVIFKDRDLTENRNKIKKYLAICKPDCCLPSQLTGEEILYYFSYLAGVPYGRTEKIVSTLIKLLEMEAIASNNISSYSEGDKRLLTCGICILRRVKILVIQDGNAGMDLYEEHILAKLIQLMKQDGQIVVVTSSNIDVCRLMCNKAGVLVNGTLKHFGNINHLDKMYYQGYTVLVRMIFENQDPEHVVDTFIGKITLKEKFRFICIFEVERKIKVGYTFQYFTMLVEKKVLSYFTIYPTKVDYYDLNNI